MLSTPFYVLQSVTLKATGNNGSSVQDTGTQWLTYEPSDVRYGRQPRIRSHDGAMTDSLAASALT